MAFLRNYAYLDAEPVLQSGRVMLRLPVMADYAEWAQLRSASRSFLEPWEPTWPRDDLTKPAFRQRVRRYNRDMRDDYAYAFFIFCQQSGTAGRWSDAVECAPRRRAIGVGGLLDWFAVCRSGLS